MTVLMHKCLDILILGIEHRGGIREYAFNIAEWQDKGYADLFPNPLQYSGELTNLLWDV